MIRTYLDAGVLIDATRGKEPNRTRAQNILKDLTGRVFISSEYVKLETYPMPEFNGKRKQLAILNAFLACVTEWVPASDDLVRDALAIACLHGLKVLDSLHVASAIEANVDQFITTERNGSRIHSASAANPIHVSHV